MNRIRSIAVVLALVAAACGGGSSDDKAKNASADGTTTTTGGTDTTAPGAAAGGSSTTAAPGASSGKTGSASGAGATTTTAPGAGGSGGGSSDTTMPPKLTATLKSKCVKPGGTQTLEVDTDPQIPVGYTSTYADGLSGMDPGYYGGSGQGVSDNEGDYTATWTITPTAPAGKVEVKVFAAGNNGVASADLTFEMANATGKCQ